MRRKKNTSIFTLSFSEEIPRHILAAETLNQLGRKKSAFIAALIEAAAKHPEAFGLICESAGLDEDGEPFRGEMSDSEFLISLMGQTGFKRKNRPKGQGRPRRTVSYESEDVRSSTIKREETEERPYQKNYEEDEPNPIPKKPVYEEAVEENEPDVIENVGDAEDEWEIPEELREAFFSNLRYFDELGEEDEDYD